MKKLFSVMMILVLALGLLTLTGCGKEEVPYSKYNLEEYITLPDYDAYTTSIPNVKIDDTDIDEEIKARLEAAATTESITKGTVDKGDKVIVSFKGTLADGTTQDGMSSDAYTMTLGSANMIDGFESGLYGATIGEEVTLNLQFPDPYTTNEELSGQDVTFVVKVISKEVSVPATLDEDFMKKEANVTTEAEYRVFIKEALEQSEYDTQLYTLKEELYTSIVENAVVLQYPEKEVKVAYEEADESYRSMAATYGYEDDWDGFREAMFGMDQEAYEKELHLYAENVVKQEMVIYAISLKEGITVSDEEYDEYLNEMLTAAGFSDSSEFEYYYGMSIEEYAEVYRLDRDLLLTKELDAIYDRIEKK